MQRYLVTLSLGFIIAITMVIGGCAKKRVPTEADAQPAEERVVETPEASEEGVKQPKSDIKETDIGSSRTMPQKKAGGDLEVFGAKPIYFDYDQFNIRQDMRSVIESNAKWLKSNPKVTLKIEGHADERGTSEYNLALGQRRAKATKQFLVALGVDTSRVTIISYGEERPTCSMQSESCYGKNRRAQFDIQGR